MALSMPFIFDTSKGETPESVARQRAVAEALIARGGTPHNVGEGIAAVGNALAYRKMMGRADAAQSAGQKSAGDAFAELAAALGGGAPSFGGSPSGPAPGMGLSLPQPPASPMPAGPTGMMVAGPDAVQGPTQAPQGAASASAMGVLPTGGGNPYASAITKIESGGNYGLIGPVTSNGDRAYGKYQVMGANVGPWTRQVLGTAMTPDQFRANPQAQDAVFNAVFGGYVKDTGSPEKAALKWFTGRTDDGALALKDVLGTSGQSYVNQFSSNMGGGAPKPASAPGGMPSGGPSAAQIIGLMSNPWASPGQQAVARALLEQQMQRQDPAYQLGLQKTQAELNQLNNPRPEYGFVMDPNTGTLIRTDKSGGTASPVYQGGPKPQDPYTIGNTRFDANNKPVATVPEKATPDIQEYQFYAEQERAAGRQPVGFSEFQIAQKKAGATSINNTVGGEALTPGWKKIDEGFADTYLDWVANGGYADVNKQIGQLGEALDVLKANPNAVATPLNALPEGLQAWMNPDGTIIRDKVYEVVQRNLRAILGAQFTENEGTRLMARAFNPNLKAPENAARIQKLATQIGAMAEAKQAAVEYFDQNGTLRGFKGKIPSAADLDKIDFGDAKPATAPAAPKPALPAAAPQVAPTKASVAPIPEGGTPIPPNGFDDAGSPPKAWTDGGGTPQQWRFVPPEQRALFQ